MIANQAELNMHAIDDPIAYELNAKQFLRELTSAVRAAASHPYHNVQNSERFVADLTWRIANLIDGTSINGLKPYFTFRLQAESNEVTLITQEDYLHEMLQDILDEEP